MVLVKEITIRKRMTIETTRKLHITLYDTLSFVNWYLLENEYITLHLIIEFHKAFMMIFDQLFTVFHRGIKKVVKMYLLDRR